MNQRIIAAFVSLVQHFDKLSSYKVSLRMKRYGHNKGGVTDFIPAETSQNIQLTCVSAKESCLKSFNAEMALLLHCRLIAMIPRPPRRVKLLQSHSHFMGQEGASLGAGDVSISVMVMPGSAGEAHSGSQPIEKMATFGDKSHILMAKMIGGAISLSSNCLPDLCGQQVGEISLYKTQNDQRCPKVVSKRLILKQICSTSSRLYWGLLFFTQLLKVPSFFITDNLVLSSRKTIKIESEVYVLVCLKHPCLAQGGAKRFFTP